MTVAPGDWAQALDHDVRANPAFRLRRLDALPPAYLSALRDAGLNLADVFGVLVADRDSGLADKVVDEAAAQLFADLHRPAPLPADAAGRFAELVMDGVLELDSHHGFISGPLAYEAVVESRELPSDLDRLGRLSHAAIRYADRLQLGDVGATTARLYFFNRIPISPRWVRAFPGPGAVEDLLACPALRRDWVAGSSSSGVPEWLWWTRREDPGRVDLMVYKLYVSPAVDDLADALPVLVDALTRAGARRFKVGPDAPGLLRPDKIVVHMEDVQELERVAGALEVALDGVRPHGVPFTADLAGDGLLVLGRRSMPRRGAGRGGNRELACVDLPPPRRISHDGTFGAAHPPRAGRLCLGPPLAGRRGHAHVRAGGPRNAHASGDAYGEPMTGPDDALVLSKRTVIVAVSELPPRAKEGLDLDAHGAFAVTRQHDRSSSTLVDERLAALLAEFRSPSTIVEAIIRYSRRAGIDAEGVLDDAYPALRRCIRHGYLVPEGSELAQLIEPAFFPGQRIAGGTVVRTVRVLEDAELHQLALDTGGMAALKVHRRGRPAFGIDAMRREARLLRHLDGRVAPRLRAEGESEHFGWLTMQWCDGRNAAAEAAARRASGRRAELLQLCVAVAVAYAELHQLGVVHGDVHPGNVIVAPDGQVRLIDFGLARRTGAEQIDDLPPRGGVHAFYDPEQAAALRAGRHIGPASYGSDQYSLAAMLYELLCGSPYLEFSIETSELLRQVVEDPPLPFTRRGHEPWPAVEQLLAASLAKNPAERLASTHELARRLALVHTPEHVVARPTSVEVLLDQVLARASPGGTWFEEGLPQGAPRCSVSYGAAGLAATIYRVAVLRADSGLLTLADEWAVRAAREADQPEAFSSSALGLTHERTGPVSPFHSLTGVHVVQGLISHALGNVNGRQRAVDAFVRESRQPCASLDVTLGRSGTLLAAALMLEVMSGARYAQLDALVTLGNDTLMGVWEAIDSMALIPDATAFAYLGVAHGWAGVMLASLRWCAAAGTPLPGTLPARLDELAQLAEPSGLGTRWPQENQQRPRRPPLRGWCHGSAGYIHLWTTAHDQLGGERWATLAERAAWHANSSDGRAAQLCCGHAGQAYGILEIYRHTGDRRWLAAAHELAAQAATAGAAMLADAPIAASLHKGVAGIAALAADLEQPELAAMPFFGRER